MKNKKIYIIAAVSVVALALIFYSILRKDLSGNIIIPYISHQKPAVDPHLPNANPIADKIGRASCRERV